MEGKVDIGGRKGLRWVKKRGLGKGERRDGEREWRGKFKRREKIGDKGERTGERKGLRRSSNSTWGLR